MSVSIFCARCGTWTDEPDQACVCDVERPAPRSVPFVEWAARFAREAETGTARAAAERVASAGRESPKAN